MRSTSILAQTNRRLLATAALGHATAVLGDEARAELVAAAALRRGGSSKVTVLAHARHLAISQMRNSPELRLDDEAELEVREFAQQLAMTRTPLERSIVDLNGRQKLNTHELGRALGISQSAAANRIKAVSEAWTEELDPVLMAWLGPGSCDALAALLTGKRLWPRHADAPVVGSIDSTGPVPVVTDSIPAPLNDVNSTQHPLTVQQFIDVMPQLRTHFAECEVCTARLAGLNGVQDVLAQVPFVEPSRELLRASRPYRQRLTTSEPPSVDQDGLKLAQLRGPLVAALCIALIAVSGYLVWNRMNAEDGPSRNSRVNELVNTAKESHLQAVPTALNTTRQQTSLSNTGTTSLLWHATSSSDWLTMEPDNGRLEPGKSQTITLVEKPTQTNSRVTTVEITANDESKLILRYIANGIPTTSQARRK